MSEPAGITMLKATDIPTGGVRWPAVLVVSVAFAKVIFSWVDLGVVRGKLATSSGDMGVVGDFGADGGDGVRRLRNGVSDVPPIIDTTLFLNGLGATFQLCNFSLVLLRSSPDVATYAS